MSKKVLVTKKVKKGKLYVIREGGKQPFLPTISVKRKDRYYVKRLKKKPKI